MQVHELISAFLMRLYGIMRALALRREANKRSISGLRANPLQSGFTLLEMMLTVGLIALTATFVGINISSSDSRLARLEAERFVALLNLAQDESILTGQPIVLKVDTDARQYNFSVLDFNAPSFIDTGTDEELGDDDDIQLADEFLKTRKIPEQVSLTYVAKEDQREEGKDSGLVIESVHELLNKSLFDFDEAKLFDTDTSREEVLIEPGGLISPFSLTFRQEEQQYVVELDRFGRAAITEP